MLTVMTLALGVLLPAPPEKPSDKPSTVHARLEPITRLKGADGAES